MLIVGSNLALWSGERVNNCVVSHGAAFGSLLPSPPRIRTIDVPCESIVVRILGERGLGVGCQKSGRKLVFLRSDIEKLLRNFVLDVCQQHQLRRRNSGSIITYFKPAIQVTFTVIVRFLFRSRETQKERLRRKEETLQNRCSSRESRSQDSSCKSNSMSRQNEFKSWKKNSMNFASNRFDCLMIQNFLIIRSGQNDLDVL